MSFETNQSVDATMMPSHYPVVRTACRPMIEEDDEEDYFKMININKPDIQSPSVYRRTMSFKHGVTCENIGSPYERTSEEIQSDYKILMNKNASQQQQEQQQQQQLEQEQQQEPQEHQPQQQKNNSPESAMLKQYLLENPFAASFIRNFL